MGGVVAFEMAQQLHAQGQRVALLALLDGRDSDRPTRRFRRKIPKRSRWSSVTSVFRLARSESLAELPKDEQLGSILAQAKSAGLVPGELDVSQARHFVKLLRNDLRATQNYGLRPYPGRITVFKASEVLSGASADPTLGWSEWAGRWSGGPHRSGQSRQPDLRASR